jgi:hypothetical protein
LLARSRQTASTVTLTGCPSAHWSLTSSAGEVVRRLAGWSLRS